MSQGTVEHVELQEVARNGSLVPHHSPSGRNTAALSVLVGCCLLQLPVWSLTMSYGLFLDAYDHDVSIHGDRSSAGAVGTTSNAVIYLSMPILFGLFTSRWASHRRLAILFGSILVSGGLALSSLSTLVWHLMVTQGVICAFASSLVYSASTLYIDEWFSTRKGLALGATLASKNIVGTGPPFLIAYLISSLDFRDTLRIWAGVTLVAGIPAVWLLQDRAAHAIIDTSRHPRRLSWTFLKHPTFYVFALGTTIFSAGYGLPQSYLPLIVSGELDIHDTSSGPLLLALFNAPGIFSAIVFGSLCDGYRVRGYTLGVFGVTLLSAAGSALAALLLWGLTPPDPSGFAMLSLFSAFYGFFAGGYSSTWAGMLREMGDEAARHQETLDQGLVYGLMNGGRGIGFLAGGFIGIKLLDIGGLANARLSYSSPYGSIILFTGLTAVCGGWGVLLKLRG